MAASLPTVKSHHSLSPNFAIFGNNAQSMPISSRRKPKMRGKSSKTVVCSSNSSRPFLQNGILRRDLMFLGLSSSLSLAFPALGAGAEEELKTDLFVDKTNAYSYLYPTALPSGKFVFKWVESRKPERYSSAAPLSPDARLRIVSERVDFIDNLIITVSIGPPNPLFLKSNDKSTWNAKDVANSVLADKSALRVTTSQRTDGTSILDAHSSTVDSEPYWYYEYLVRKSPTEAAPSSNLYRHFVAVTAEREGYLYSLNASTLSMQWDKMGPFLEKTVASFHLLPPTENYVPPYKDPWRFW
ncbi:psbP domain-containing protein 5, chloroplastic [Salvia miltiorrhiza]|uniref:psbP domain-containing protein 5, chloroplastic n=1 Tax=Salvia miltiorrhiza TaxID=226208 RepID=UPI0025AD052D|nr:psbP domain-containing protein 5, chloroplastic [Salvia miltiorrhiza]